MRWNANNKIREIKFTSFIIEVFNSLRFSYNRKIDDVIVLYRLNASERSSKMDKRDDQ